MCSPYPAYLTHKTHQLHNATLCLPLTLRNLRKVCSLGISVWQALRITSFTSIRMVIKIKFLSEKKAPQNSISGAIPVGSCHHWCSGPNYYVQTTYERSESFKTPQNLETLFRRTTAQLSTLSACIQRAEIHRNCELTSGFRGRAHQII